MLIEQTYQKLSEMKWHGFSAALTEQMDNDDYRELDFGERIGLLVDREWTERKNRKLTRRLQEAKFREQACIEDIDYRQRSGLDRSLVQRLATCKWVAEQHNIIITGPTGVGKTFVGCALAHKACREGYSALYRRVPRLHDELALARADGSLPKLFTRLARIHVLVLDDWALTPWDDQGRRDMLEVIEDRHGLRSTIVTSQFPVDAWHKAIGEPSIADAILDRLVHNSHRITLKGPSGRPLRSKINKEDSGK